MIGNITVAAVQQKSTKTGKPYLAVKSKSGSFYSIWEDYQAIWHLFVEGAHLQVEVVVSGAFKNITGVVGVDMPQSKENVPTGQNGATNGSWATVIEKLFARLDNIENKLDLLVEQKVKETREDKLPPLNEDIKVESIPF